MNYRHLENLRTTKHQKSTLRKSWSHEVEPKQGQTRAKQITHRRRRQKLSEKHKILLGNWMIQNLWNKTIISIQRNRQQSHSTINQEIHKGQKQSDQYIFTRQTQFIFKRRRLYTHKQSNWDSQCKGLNSNKTHKFFTSKTIRNHI